MLRRITLAGFVLLAAVGCGTRSSSEISPELIRALDNPGLGVGSAASPTTGAGAKLRFARGAEQFVYGARDAEVGAGGTPQRQTIGGALYEARLGTRTGAIYVKRHDAQAGLTLTPAGSPLALGPGIERSGSAVYAATGGESAVVLAAKANGVKEDIVLTRPLGDRLVFEWELALEPGLEARLDGEGNVNVYGPSQFLWGDIQISDDTSRQLVEKARQNASKDQLLYRIPAPVIRQASGAAPRDSARFALRGSRLTLVAGNLRQLDYPISIDPTVLVTTTQDFAFGGNNEGGVEISGDQVKRGKIAGGVGNWAASTAFPTARFGHTSVAYNGYLYVIGGYGSAGLLNDVQVAPINANGTVGAWTATAALPTARDFHTSVAYNGYLYVIGGYGAAAPLNDVQVAPINADGTVGAWAATNVFPTARYRHTSVAYNGYLYVIGGLSSAGLLNDVQVAPINANGTVGAWAATTAFPTARGDHTSVAYNGYLYVIGGSGGSTAYRNDVQVAPINANGTVGAWAATTAFPTARYGHTSVACNGYLYVIGGQSSAGSLNDMQVAPINANGTVGAWTATTAFPTARYSHASVTYNGYLYVIGGSGGSTAYLNDVQVAPINANGTVGAWTATTAFPTARSEHTSVAYSGYLYVIGGGNGAGSLSDVRVTPINANGTVGAWTATTAFPTARHGHTSVAYNGTLYVIGGYGRNDVQVAPIIANGTVGAWTATYALPTERFGHTSVAYNGYLYVIGGYGSNDVQVAPIAASGTVGAWTATTALPTVRYYHSSVVYNGYVYVIGGGNGAASLNDVQVAPINANGTVGAWTDTTALPTARYSHTSVVYNGYLYVIGGQNSSGAYLNDVQVALINANGTVGAWAASTAFPTARSGHTSVVYNGYLYVIGGQNSSGAYLNDVQVAPINAGGPPARGFYSKLLDLSTTVTSVDSVTVNGLAANPGTVSLQYRVAPASGIFGATVDRGVIPLGAAVPLGDLDVRYVWLRFLLDDTNSDATTERDVTDFTLAYGAGLCVGVTCTALDQCHDVGTCSPVTGVCSNPNKANGAACNDGDGCTSGETCQGGACGSPAATVTCTALDQCHDVGTCAPATGACSNPSKANGTACNDGNACTSGETCQGGACGSPAATVTCTALDQCHDVGTCVPATGVCSNPDKANGAACNDGNACTQTDACQAGACTGSNPVVCGGADACHDAVCTPATGACSNPNKVDGTPCGGGCASACQSGTCTAGGSVTCNPLDQCHVAGLCDPTTGMCSNPPAANGTSCNDNNACTQADSCQAGVCGGTPIVCTASDACHTAGACNTSTGVCSNPLTADGTPCTGGTCQNGSCTPSDGGAGDGGPDASTGAAGAGGDGGTAGAAGGGGTTGAAGAGGAAGTTGRDGGTDAAAARDGGADASMMSTGGGGCGCGLSSGAPSATPLLVGIGLLLAARSRRRKR